MPVDEILKTAIYCRRPVELLTGDRLRHACPHALGHKDYRRKVLVYQVSGESESGLPSGGAWRSFFLEDIAWARLVDGPWRSGRNRLHKIEASFDHVDAEVSPQERAPGRAQPLARATGEVTDQGEI